MSSGSAPSQTEHSPRTHAERTAETRERVMQAVVESLAECGFKRTTAAEISRRAGVSWGAVQHHFGDKNGILLAVLEESFKYLAVILEQPGVEGADLETRVSLFVDRSWEHFASPHYRSMLEILLNLPAELEPSWQKQTLFQWRTIWSLYFPERDASSPHTLELMRYSIAALSGLATLNTLEGRRAQGRELRFLKDTLIRALDDQAH